MKGIWNLSVLFFANVSIIISPPKIFFKYRYGDVWAPLVAQMVKNLLAMQETKIRSLSQEDPLEKVMITHPLQYSCLENPMDRGAWQAIVRGVTKSLTPLSD